MTSEQEELLDSMVDGFLQDILYQFNLDKDYQAIKLVQNSIKRLEEAHVQEKPALKRSA